MFVIPLNPFALEIRWNEGSHYAHVFDAETEIDVFTFAWEKNSPTEEDFMSAYRVWLAGE